MTKPTPQKHVEVEDFKESDPDAGPSETDFNIQVSLPDRIEIKMVDASALSDYEIWFFGSGVWASFFAGFTVAAMQEKEPYPAKILTFVAALMGLAFLAFMAMTLFKRHRLTQKFRTIQLKTTRAMLKPSASSSPKANDIQG